MLVGKDELKNAWQLTKVRLRNATTGRLGIFSGVAGVVFLINLLLFIAWLARENNGLDSFSWLDLSSLLFFVLIFVLISNSYYYRTNNQNYTVFPQTNTSRFLSSQVCTYILITSCALLLLVFYLLAYGVSALVVAIFSNVHLVFEFDLAFVVAGFFVFLVYLSLVTGLLTLLAALIRRFKLYAVMAIAAAIGVLFARFFYVLELMRILFNLFLFDQNILLFLLKGIVLWLVLFVLALIVNKFTVYHKESIRLSMQKIIVVTFTSVLVFAAPTFFVVPNPDSETTFDKLNDSSFFEWNLEQIVIDISVIPDGSRIEIVPGSNIALIKEPEKIISRNYSPGLISIEYEDGTIEEYPDDYLMIYYPKELSSIKGNKLVIVLSGGYNIVRSHDLEPLIGQTLEARMEGTTLYLDYHKKNEKAVFLPVWSFMWQYSYFRDIDVVDEIFDTITFVSPAEVFFRVE